MNRSATITIKHSYQLPMMFQLMIILVIKISVQTVRSKCGGNLDVELTSEQLPVSTFGRVL